MTSGERRAALLADIRGIPDDACSGALVARWHGEQLHWVVVGATTRPGGRPPSAARRARIDQRLASLRHVTTDQPEPPAG